jgi:hypothetical protein
VLTFLSILVISLIAVIGMYAACSWVVLLCIVWLFSLAIFPKKSPALTWPVGLLVAIGANYVSYVVAWVNKVQLITPTWSRVTLLAVLMTSISLALIRLTFQKDEVVKSQYSFPSVLIICIPSILILVWAGFGILTNPIGMVAANLTGGDHSMHVGLSINFTALTGSPYLRSPFDLYGYPSALHYLITNLAQIDLIQNDSSPVFHFHLVAAWFERLQFAAFVQLYIFIAVCGIKSSRSKLILGVLVAVISLLSIPNSIAQLIWSGFTTSLGGVWMLLLLPFLGILLAGRKGRDLYLLFLFLIVGLVLFSVYQPLIIISAAVFLFHVVHKLFGQKYDQNKLSLSCVFPAALGFVIAALPICVAYLIQGKNNSGFQTINLAGALLVPSHGIAIAIVLLTTSLIFVSALRGDFKDYQSILSTVTVFLFGYLGLVSSLIFVVSQIKQDSQSLTPYYIEKLIWGLIFVGMPILLMALFMFLDSVDGLFHKSLWAVTTTAAVFLLVSQSLEIKKQFRHEKISWVATGVQTIQKGQLPLRAVTYFSGDHLGSHVGTLAIGWVSEVTLPFELRITDRIDWVCNFISDQRVTTVFTAHGGLDELIANGCPEAGVSYIESSL